MWTETSVGRLRALIYRGEDDQVSVYGRSVGQHIERRHSYQVIKQTANQCTSSQWGKQRKRNWRMNNPIEQISVNGALTYPRSGLAPVLQSRRGLALLSLRGSLCSVELITDDQPDSAAPPFAWEARGCILAELAFRCLGLALVTTLAQARAYLRVRLCRMERPLHLPPA
jgi:hypothetical protein